MRKKTQTSVFGLVVITTALAARSKFVYTVRDESRYNGCRSLLSLSGRRVIHDWFMDALLECTAGNNLSTRWNPPLIAYGPAPDLILRSFHHTRRQPTTIYLTKKPSIQ